MDINDCILLILYWFIWLVCGGTYLSNHGSLSSPNFPHNYYVSSDCVYKIVVPIGSTIKLKFTDFHLEPARAGEYVLKEKQIVWETVKPTVLQTMNGKIDKKSLRELGKERRRNWWKKHVIRALRHHTFSGQNYCLSHDATWCLTTHQTPAQHSDS